MLFACFSVNFPSKVARVSFFCSIFAHDFENRDVAQLVAHYVRDVGVGRSSRLIPTQKKEVAFLLLPFLLE